VNTSPPSGIDLPGAGLAPESLDSPACGAVHEEPHTQAASSAWDNPMGTDGFEFIEYAAPDPKAMGEVFKRMGFTPIARHRHKDVTLYRQGSINFIVNAEPGSSAQRFARQHGPGVCAIAFRVLDAKAANERAISLGAWGHADTAGPGELNIPAIKGIGDSIIISSTNGAAKMVRSLAT
jgi:4-hydroxyphenylpyruvate dioxygenase